MCKTILITGGSGLVGQGIHSIQENYNYNFVFASSKDCDLENYFQTIEYFKLLSKIFAPWLPPTINSVNLSLILLDDCNL